MTLNYLQPPLSAPIETYPLHKPIAYQLPKITDNNTLCAICVPSFTEGTGGINPLEQGVAGNPSLM